MPRPCGVLLGAIAPASRRRRIPGWTRWSAMPSTTIATSWLRPKNSASRRLSDAPRADVASSHEGGGEEECRSADEQCASRAGAGHDDRFKIRYNTGINRKRSQPSVETVTRTRCSISKEDAHAVQGFAENARGL